MSDLIPLEVVGLGVPIDNRFRDEVRDRARKLALRHPDFYQLDPTLPILHCNTTDNAVFKPIYNWVLLGIGEEPG